MSSATVKWNGKELSAAIKKSAVSGLKDAAEFLLDEAKKLVPIDEGTLENSGNTSVDEASMESTVYFDTPYAVKQHEDMSLQHTGNRQAKYLETPAKENRKKLIEIVADSIKEATS